MVRFSHLAVACVLSLLAACQQPSSGDLSAKFRAELPVNGVVTFGS